MGPELGCFGSCLGERDMQPGLRHCVTHHLCWELITNLVLSQVISSPSVVVEHLRWVIHLKWEDFPGENRFRKAVWQKGEKPLEIEVFKTVVGLQKSKGERAEERIVRASSGGCEWGSFLRRSSGHRHGLFNCSDCCSGDGILPVELVAGEQFM